MKKEQSVAFWIWLGMISAAGSIAVHVMTSPFGLGLIPDSIEYLQGAKYLVLGQGFAGYDKAGHLVANSWYGPGLSMLLSLGWFFGLSFVDWARLFNIFLFGVNIFLAGSIVYYLSRSVRAGLVTALFFTTSVHLLEVHGKLISEPLFLSVFLGTCLSVLVFIDTGSRRSLYLAALCAGLSVLTRYSGIPVITAVALWLWVWKRDKGGARDTGIFLLVSLLIPLVLFVRNMVLTGYPAGSGFAYYPQYAERILIVVNSFSEWLLPSKFPPVMRWAVLGFCLIGLVQWLRVNWRQFNAAIRKGLSLIGIFTGVYIAMVFFAGFFRGTDIVLTHRLMAPVYALMVIGLGMIVSLESKAWTLKKRLWTALFLIFFIFTFLRAGQLAVSFYKNGFDYAARKLTTSRLVETLRSIDDRVPLYSNRPEAVWHFSGRPAVRIPSAGEDDGFFPPMGTLANDFKNQRAVAIIFEQEKFVLGKKWNAAVRELELEVLMKDPQGNIYGVRKK